MAGIIERGSEKHKAHLAGVEKDKAVAKKQPAKKESEFELKEEAPKVPTRKIEKPE